MRVQAFLAAVLSSCLTPATAQSLPSLFDALVAAGASNFAALIQANPNASALYSSGAVKTVFAPADWAPGISSLTRRDATAVARLAYQACLGTTSLQVASMSSKYGLVLSTALKSSKLADNSQKVVPDTRPANATTPVSKRQLLDSRATQRRATNSTSLLRIEAGLGNVSNVVQEDIVFDGGLIQLTDSYFTIPLSLSSTSSQTGQTTFNSLANQSNLTNTLDNSESITVFLPSNAAFAAIANGTTSTSSLISNHVVNNFVGYLPTLTDGLTLTTKTGGILTVSIRNDIWYINNAKVIQANLVLENGVAHVIDQVLVPTPASVVTASGNRVLGSALAAFVCLPLAFLSLLL